MRRATQGTRAELPEYLGGLEDLAFVDGPRTAVSNRSGFVSGGELERQTSPHDFPECCRNLLQLYPRRTLPLLVPRGTQAGTYTVVVSASATAGVATLTHNVKRTLIGQ